MDKKVLNIVVTGGPCGGKTTALNELTILLRDYGYTVYIVNETATELINDGIRPFGEYQIPLKEFQALLLDAQIAKEDIRKRAVSLCSNSKVAILYDRGILDNRSYITDEIFDEFMKDRGITESEILSRYDIVFHLVSAAIGKEEYYTTLNNSARTETVLEARIQDGKTLNTWRNHPNLVIVGNDTLFDEKIEKIKNYLRGYIGENEVVEQEKYLIDLEDIDFSYIKTMSKENIEEFAIPSGDQEIEVYSKSSINGSSYYMRSKNNYQGTSKTTIRRTIREKEYLHFLSLYRGNIVKKIRYNFIDGSERFRLDIYVSSNYQFAILERDVSDRQRKGLPLFIKSAMNISDYQNCDDYFYQKKYGSINH